MLSHPRDTSPSWVLKGSRDGLETGGGPRRSQEAPALGSESGSSPHSLLSRPLGCAVLAFSPKKRAFHEDSSKECISAVRRWPVWQHQDFLWRAHPCRSKSPWIFHRKCPFSVTLQRVGRGDAQGGRMWFARPEVRG